MAEIGIKEAAARLHRSTETIAKKAIAVTTELQARNALKAKRLPGRKIGRFWLFDPRNVAAFGRIKRPSGRPPVP